MQVTKPTVAKSEINGGQTHDAKNERIDDCPNRPLPVCPFHSLSHVLVSVFNHSIQSVWLPSAGSLYRLLWFVAPIQQAEDARA